VPRGAEEPQVCRSIVSRMACARPVVAAWRRPDARRSRSWRSLVSRLRKRNGTPRKPAKSGWRQMHGTAGRANQERSLPKTPRSSLGKSRKDQEKQRDGHPAGALGNRTSVSALRRRGIQGPLLGMTVEREGKCARLSKLNKSLTSKIDPSRYFSTKSFNPRDRGPVYWVGRHG
jgi:hypothetical protein